MATRTKGVDPRDVTREQAEHQTLENNLAAGRAQPGLQDLIHQNPEMIEQLAGVEWPDGSQSDKAWLPEIAEEHLHMDQVFAIYDAREMWAKEWLNPNVADKILMSYPCPETRMESDRQREVVARIRGDRKSPLDADQRRKLKAALERKTDRERRAKGGKFMELILKKVIRSEDSTRRDDDSGGLLSGVLGGGR